MIAKLDAIADYISDRVNPIVMKELRQSMRNWAVIFAIMLMLGIQVLVMGLFLLKESGRVVGSETLGADLFRVLNATLFIISCTFIPLYAGVRFLAERNNMDLMFITTLRPSSIVFGKWLSAVMIAILMYSASLPFMTLTYQLRGIDVPTIITIMTANFILVISASAVTIFMASFATGLGLIIIAFLVSVGVICMALFSGLAFGSLLGFYGTAKFIGGMSYWIVIPILLCAAAYKIGFNLVLGTAAISPPASNRMFPVRLYITIGMVLMFIAAAVIYNQTGAKWPVYAWTSLYGILPSFAMFIAISERDSWGPRVTRKIPRNIVGKILAYLFFTGSPGGIVWCVLMAALAMVGYCFLEGRLHGDEILRWVGLMLYVLAACATSIALRNSIFKKILPIQMTWLVAVLLMTLNYMIPVLYYFISDRPYRMVSDTNGLATFSPIGLFGSNESARASVVFAALWAGVMCAVILPWFIRSTSRFRHVHHVSQNLPMSVAVQPSGGNSVSVSEDTPSSDVEKLNG